MTNLTVIKTITTHKDATRSDCIEREMHRKLFGGQVPPGPAGGAHSTPRPPAAFMRGQGNGEGRAGRKDKKGYGRMVKDRRKERGKGMKERRWVVRHPKLNPGCASGVKSKVFVLAFKPLQPVQDLDLSLDLKNIS